MTQLYLKREAEMVQLMHSLSEELRDLRQLKSSLISWPTLSFYPDSFSYDSPLPSVLKLASLEDSLSTLSFPTP